MRVFAFFLMSLPFQEPAPPVFYESLEGNAADVYLSLKDRLGKDHPVDEVLYHYADEGIGDRDAVRDALTPFEDVFKTVERAVRMKRCVWDHPGLKSIGGDTPHLFVGTRLSTLYSARARLRLEKGEVAAALDDLLTLGRIGSDLMQDRLFLIVLVGRLCTVKAHDLWCRGFASQDLNAALLRRAEAHLSRLIDRFPRPIVSIEQDKDLLLGSVDRMLTDLPQFLWDFGAGGPLGKKEDFKKGQWGELGAVLSAEPGAARIVLRKRLEEAFARHLKEAVQPLYSKEPRHDREAEIKDLDRRWKAWKLTGKDKATGVVLAAEILVSITASPHSYHLETYADVNLMLDLQRARCRLDLLRLKTGVYPDELDASVSFTDPFTGNPIRYARIAEPQQEAFVLTREGPKADWKERIRVLSRECRFELDDYDRRGRAFSDLSLSTIWARHPR